MQVIMLVLLAYATSAVPIPPSDNAIPPLRSGSPARSDHLSSDDSFAHAIANLDLNPPPSPQDHLPSDDSFALAAADLDLDSPTTPSPDVSDPPPDDEGLSSDSSFERAANALDLYTPAAAGDAPGYAADTEEDMEIGSSPTRDSPRTPPDERAIFPFDTSISEQNPLAASSPISTAADDDLARAGSFDNADLDDNEYFDVLLNSFPDSIPGLLDAEDARRSSPRSSETDTTTDEINRACDMPPGPQRDAAFGNIARYINARRHCTSGNCHCTPPPSPSPPSPPATAGRHHAASQTYVSLPERLSDRLHRTLLAGLHSRHTLQLRHPDGTYTDHNAALHSRDRDTAPGRQVYGPVPHAPWPPFMQNINGITQTPLGFTIHTPPSEMDYLRIGLHRGLHDPIQHRTWVPVPAPIQPYIPDLLPDQGLSFAVSRYATGMWIYSGRSAADQGRVRHGHHPGPDHHPEFIDY